MEGGAGTVLEHAGRDMQEVILCSFNLPVLKNILIIKPAMFPQSKAGKPIYLLVLLENT